MRQAGVGGMLEHPMLRLELRRVHRRRWWPGRRFFMFYPALLGVALGYGVILVLTNSPQMQLAALVTGVPTVCLLALVTEVLAFGLAWIAPAVTAVCIAREQELGTLDLLRVTSLTERSIVLGKLGGCLVQLWPGILALALMTPFRLFWVGGWGGASVLSALSTLRMESLSPAEWEWEWMLLLGVAGLIRPWADLALHAAVGLFVSVLSRTSGVAVAISYGATIAIWVALRLAQSTLSSVLISMPGVATDAQGTILGSVLMLPAVISLGAMLVEFAGAGLLVWGAIWWLKRR